ncbi:MAG: hypothetical protein ACE5DQ_00535, partial [Candidatus Paceibacterota bacterium]
MNKRTTSIVIGLILATVVVAGGFFLLQRRGGRAAGSVTDASCTGDVGSFTFTYTTSSCGKDSTIVYGQDMENLLYVNDSSQKSDE